MQLQQMSNRWGFGLVRQTIEHNHLCELCPKTLAKMGKVVSGRPEWVDHYMLIGEKVLNQVMDQTGARVLIVAELRWEDMPQRDRVCTCSGFSTGCEASPHLVRVESLPVQSELAAFVQLPLEVCSGVPDV